MTEPLCFTIERYVWDVFGLPRVISFIRLLKVLNLDSLENIIFFPQKALSFVTNIFTKVKVPLIINLSSYSIVKIIIL